ncbi:hypothetical protein PoB_005993100 [Plakobranchus ocellatus]|uniref:Uncharacterized protein n=1 Tax=Plakobranchus ocellatus TaxID=259542 RepID=A0AAV4CNI6_9GAST|nr:hypothetical protein PoB_005993100 [Plakobranchus ocellatus]
MPGSAQYGTIQSTKKVISDFQGLLQAKAPVKVLESGTDEFLQILGRGANPFATNAPKQDGQWVIKHNTTQRKWNINLIGMDNAPDGVELGTEKDDMDLN